jgi:hypothetical protein
VEYAREAFDQLSGSDDSVVTWLDNVSGFEIYPPDDLKRRYDFLPPELYKKDKAIRLTTDRDLVMESLDKAREANNRWPEWELFWEQHPVADWLTDRVLGEFGRHSAPVLEISQGLDGVEWIFLCQGIISNLRSQPVIIDWFGVPFGQEERGEIMALDALLEVTRLDQAPPNPASGISGPVLERLMEQRAASVTVAINHMLEIRNRRAEALSAELRESVRALKDWKDSRIAASAMRQERLFGDKPGAQKRREKIIDQDRKHAEDIYKHRHDWINEVLRTSKRPFIRIAAVFIRGGRG